MSSRPHPITIAIVAAAIPLTGCKKQLPTATTKPPGTEEPGKPADSLEQIGIDAASLVKLWVLALSGVESDESAATTAKSLSKIEDQFDYLAERAEQLPKLSPEEFKRIDDSVDAMLNGAASGLEAERKRIFLLPPSVKDQILPIHERLLSQFRSMSRTISTVASQPPPTAPGSTPIPLDAPGQDQ